MFGPPAGAQEDPVAGGVALLEIEGQLDLGTLAVLRRSIREARGSGYARLIVELDTPGGEIELMWQIAKAIESAREQGVMTVAWVHDRALSAGVLVAISCEKVYMSTGGVIGAAQPILVGPLGISPAPQKQVAAFTSQVRACAEAHARSPALAQAMVDPEAAAILVRDHGALRILNGREWADARIGGDPPELVREVSGEGQLLSLTGREAVALGFADGLAETVDEVLEKIGAHDAPLLRIERTRSEELLGRWNRFALVLVVFGFLLGFVELKMPGFGLPGILSVVCFAAFFTGRYLLGLADVPHIVLAAVGVALVAVELLVVPGTLWVGILGGLLLVAGLVLGQLGPGFSFANPLDQKLVLAAAQQLALAALASVAGVWLLSRFLPNTPILGRLVLDPGNLEPAGEALPEARGEPARAARVGALGKATSDLRPVGKIVLDSSAGFEFEARSGGNALERGARVRVVEVVGGRLVVEPVAGEEAR